MPSWLLIITGLVLITIAMIDVLWSTVSTNGGGPIAMRVAHGCWALGLLVFRRLRLHRILEFNTVVILVATFLVWVIPMWVGWTLIFSAGEGVVIHQTSGEIAGLRDRAYFSGMVFLTLGSGDFVAQGANWRLATIAASLNGLVVITLTITYLLSVMSAAIEKRQLAIAIRAAGQTPSEILANAWNGDDFAALEDRLYSFSVQLILHAERHLAYPVLQYFHPTDREAALPVALALLDDTTTLLSHCLDENQRFSETTMHSLHGALEVYIRRVQLKHISDIDHPPPIPKLQSLREQGVPICDEQDAQKAFAERVEFRCTLQGLLHAEGWQWPH